MRQLHTALGFGSFIAVAAATAMTLTMAIAATVEKTYVACNWYGDC